MRHKHRPPSKQRAAVQLRGGEMKIKIIGLAAVAAMALTSISASSAAAKACSATLSSGEACGGTYGFVYTGTLEASLKAGTSFTFTATNSSGQSISTITCTTSTLKGSVTGSTGVGSINAMTLANCSSAMCANAMSFTTTASATNLWPIQVTTGTPPNGTLAIEKFDMEMICGTLLGNITCRYTSAKVMGTVGGGAPAHVTATTVPLATVSGPEAVCGSKADWSATYVVTNPKSLYLT